MKNFVTRWVPLLVLVIALLVWQYGDQLAPLLRSVGTNFGGTLRDLGEHVRAALGALTN